MEAGLEDLDVAAEGLVDAQLGSWNLVDRALEAAAYTRAPDMQTSRKGATALEAGFVACALEFLALEVLEVLVITLVDDFVLLHRFEI